MIILLIKLGLDGCCNSTAVYWPRGQSSLSCLTLVDCLPIWQPLSRITTHRNLIHTESYHSMNSNEMENVGHVLRMGGGRPSPKSGKRKGTLETGRSKPDRVMWRQIWSDAPTNLRWWWRSVSGFVLKTHDKIDVLR